MKVIRIFIKIGRSSNIYNRINSYENGTIVYLIIECNNSEKNEAELIKIFNKEFKNIKYYGSEYFQGELLIMKNLIINHIKKNTSDDINLIDKDIKITTVDKETDLHIPKYKQEIYSKAKLSIIKIVEDLEIKEEDNSVSESTEYKDDNFEDCLESNDNDDNDNDNNNNENENEIINSINNNIETINNNSNGNIIINNFSNSNKNDRICPCGMLFPYPSQLKRHHNGKLGCISYLQSLQTQHLPNTNNVEEQELNIKEFLCQHCNKKYSTKFNLQRHNNVCKKQKVSISMEQILNGFNTILTNNNYEHVTIKVNDNKISASLKLFNSQK